MHRPLCMQGRISSLPASRFREKRPFAKTQLTFLRKPRRLNALHQTFAKFEAIDMGWLRGRVRKTAKIAPSAPKGPRNGNRIFAVF
jgi:hypothetical protein